MDYKNIKFPLLDKNDKIEEKYLSTQLPYIDGIYSEIPSIFIEHNHAGYVQFEFLCNYIDPITEAIFNGNINILSYPQRIIAQDVPQSKDYWTIILRGTFNFIGIMIQSACSEITVRVPPLSIIYHNHDDNMKTISGFGIANNGGVPCNINLIIPECVKTIDPNIFIGKFNITGLIFESYNNMDSVCESLSVSIDDERVKTIDVLS